MKKPKKPLNIHQRIQEALNGIVYYPPYFRRRLVEQLNAEREQCCKDTCLSCSRNEPVERFDYYGAIIYLHPCEDENRVCTAMKIRARIDEEKESHKEV